MNVDRHRRGLEFNRNDGHRHDHRGPVIQLLRQRLHDERPPPFMRDEHRNRISTDDLTVLLNAALDVIGVPVSDRYYAKALAAMESASLEE